MLSLRFQALALSVLIFSGCTSIESRLHGRTATEQYLVTAAVERALEDVRWDRLAGKRVKLKVSAVQELEKDFVQECIRRHLAAEGAKLVESVTGSDVVVKALVESVGSDIWIGNFGIPLIATTHPEVPAPVGGISLFNSNHQQGYCRMQLFGYHPKTEKLLWRIGPVHGDSYFKTSTLLGLFGPYKSSDIFPERKYFRPKGYIPQRVEDEEGGAED